MDRIVISGVGLVTPIGIGKEQFWDNVAKGKPATKAAAGGKPFQEFYCGKIVGLDFEGHIPYRGFRRAADVSKYAIVAADAAIKDMGVTLSGDGDTALVMGITHGAITYTQAFHSSLVKEGGCSVSPLFFADSVLNAPASNVSICLGIRGSVHTLLGGNSVSLKALSLACRLIEEGRVPKAVVASSEEVNELSFFCNSQLGVISRNDFPSEGSGAVFIERESTVKGTSPYCYLLGTASFCNPLQPEQAIMEAVEMALEMASLELKDIHFIMADKPLCGVPIPWRSIIPLTGHAFPVSAIWHLILSSMILKKGVVPASMAGGTELSSGGIRHIMICSSERHGIVSVAIVSRYDNL